MWGNPGRDARDPQPISCCYRVYNSRGQQLVSFFFVSCMHTSSPRCGTLGVVSNLSAFAILHETLGVNFGSAFRAAVPRARHHCPSDRLTEKLIESCIHCSSPPPPFPLPPRRVFGGGLAHRRDFPRESPRVEMLPLPTASMPSMLACRFVVTPAGSRRVSPLKFVMDGWRVRRSPRHHLRLLGPPHHFSFDCGYSRRESPRWDSSKSTAHSWWEGALGVTARPSPPLPHSPTAMSLILHPPRVPPYPNPPRSLTSRLTASPPPPLTASPPYPNPPRPPPPSCRSVYPPPTHTHTHVHILM